MNDKRYTNLLAALAQFLKESADPMTLREFTDGYTTDKWIAAGNLDEFLSGYAGEDWIAAKERAMN